MITTYDKLLDVFNDPFLIGFTREFERLNTIQKTNVKASYPPYNVLRHSDDEYTLSLAVAGFQKQDLEVSVEKGILVIKGDIEDQADEQQYLYKGIATRKFTREFALGEYMEVGTTRLDAGILYIDIARKIPEDQKPRAITIK